MFFDFITIFSINFFIVEGEFLSLPIFFSEKLLCSSFLDFIIVPDSMILYFFQWIPIIFLATSQIRPSIYCSPVSPTKLFFFNDDMNRQSLQIHTIQDLDFWISYLGNLLSCWLTEIWEERFLFGSIFRRPLVFSQILGDTNIIQVISFIFPILYIFLDPFV